MKEFFKWVLVILVYVIGYIGIELSHAHKWSEIITFPMSLLIYAPAMYWWKGYFDELFDN